MLWLSLPSMLWDHFFKDRDGDKKRKAFLIGTRNWKKSGRGSKQLSAQHERGRHYIAK